MFVDTPSVHFWIELLVVGGAGAIGTPFIIYFLSQNSERKKQREADRKHYDEALGDLRDRTTKLQTTVDLKKELVDKVQATQIADGLRLATLEANVSSIKESQKRTEELQTQIMGKLDTLARIEEKVEGLQDDVRDLRDRKSE